MLMHPLHLSTSAPATFSRTAIMWMVGALVLILVVLAYVLDDRYQQAEAAATTEARNQVQVLEAHVAGNFARIDAMLIYATQSIHAAHTPPIRWVPHAPSGIEQRLADLKVGFPGIESLNVFDSHGVLRYTSSPRAQPTDTAGHDDFQRLRDYPELNLAFSQARPAGATKQWTMGQSRALRDEQGRFLGTVNAVLNLDKNSEQFNPAHVREGGLMLLRRSDTFALIQRVPRLNEKDFNQPLTPHNPIRQRIESGEQEGTLILISTTDGIERLSSFKVLEHYPFYVQVGLAKTYYLAHWEQGFVAIIGFTLFLILGFIVVIRHLEKTTIAAEFAQHQILYRQALFSGMFEQSSFLAGILSHSGHLIEVNQTALAVIGQSRDNVIGQYFPETPWWSRPQDKAALKILLESAAKGTPGSVEVMHPVIHGGEIAVFLHTVPVQAQGDHYIAVIGIDITKRKQAEEALKESELRQRAIIENEPECIKIVDAQGHLVQMNPAGLKMIEAESFNQVACKPVVKLIAPEYRKAFNEMHQRVLQGESVQLAFEIIGLKGGRHWMETHAVPIQQNGQTAQLAVTRDITERKLAEMALQQKTEALARSNAELEQFAYIVSHDLRQPLRMITSYVQMLERRLSNQLDIDTRQMMGFAIDGAKRMDQMLVSLLEYSRVGRQGEPLVLMDSRDSVDEALRFLAPAITEAKASIYISGNWPQIIASRDELTRLWQNIIGNAIKYCNPHCPPIIKISVVSDVAGLEVEKNWYFCVTDNGIGIDPEQFSRLFRVFQRLHTRSQYEGSGIGLAVAKKIVTRHGGRIWVESQGADQGCQFYFTLPINNTNNTN